MSEGTPIAGLSVLFDVSEVDAATAAFERNIAAGGKLEASGAKVTLANKQVGAASSGAASAVRDMAEQVNAAEAALARQAQGAMKAASATEKLAQEAQRASASYGDFYTAAQNNFATQYAAGLDKVSAAHGRAVTSSKGMTQATLNLSRQFADVGVTAAMGMSPLMILIQQGPQIAGVFQEASAAGLGFRAVLAGIQAQVAPLLIPLAGVAAGLALIAAPWAIAAQQMNKANGDLTKGLGLTADQMEKVKNKGVTMGDVFKGTFQTIGEYIWAGIGESMTKAGAWIGKVYQNIVDGTLALGKAIVGTIGGAVGAIRSTWSMLPRAIGDFMITGANLAIKAVEGMVNKVIGAINKLIGGAQAAAKAAGLTIQMPTLNSVTLGAIANPFEGAGRAAVEAWKGGWNSGADGAIQDVIDFAKRVEENIDGVGQKRVLTEAGKAKAAKMAKPSGSLKDGLGKYESVGDAQQGAVVSLAEKADKSPLAGLKDDIQTLNQIIADGAANAANLYADVMAQAASATRDAARGMADAFGSVGGAIGGLATVLADYDAKQADISARRLDEAARYQAVLGDTKASAKDKADAENRYTTSEILLSQDAANARIKQYGDIAGAAKGFFKEGSKGYKALEAAEKFYRAYEMAMSLKSMVTKLAHTATATGAHVAGVGAQVTATAAGEAAHTALTAAGTAVRTPLKIAEGAATMFATLGPFGFAAVGAMIAVMAGLGASSKGGGGLGYSVADKQAAQGTGSVLGDPTAKSDSIAKSLEKVASNSNRDLEYSNGMLKALRSIDDQIGAVANALAKALGVGGALNPGNLGLGTTGTTPSLSNLGFSKSTTKTLADMGVAFAGQTVADIIANGVQGSTYQSVTTNKKSTAFGITLSNKTSTATTEEALTGDLQRQITLLVGSLKAGVLSAATVLGVTGAEKVLDAFTLEIGQISLKDMSSQEIQDTLNAVFSKVGDDMASAAATGLSAFQKAGEGLFETLTRVARDYQVVDTSLTSIGMAFGAVGLASVEARERLVLLTGGIDALAEGAGFFAENFLSEAERMAPIQNAVTNEMKRLGLESVTTKDQFKNLVRGLDLSTAAGAEMFAALMAVAPAFAKVADYMGEAAKAANDNAAANLEKASNGLDKARSDLVAAYDREASAIEATISTFKDLAKSLSKFRQSLYSGPAAMLSPEEAYKAAKTQFEQTRAKALGGDKGAIADLQSVSEAYLNASKDYYASSKGYFADLEAVRQAVTATESLAQSQVDQAEAQLAALTTQVGLLVELNKSVLSVKDAIAALAVAQAAVTNATAMASLPAYLQANPDVAAAYAEYAAGKGTWSQTGYGTGLDAAGFAARHYELAGQAEGRARIGFATGGSFMVGGNGGTDTTPVSFMATRGEMVRVSRPGENDNAEVVSLLKDLRDELRADKVQRGAATMATIEALEGVKTEVGGVRRTIRGAA